ncbi:integral membrane sensor signal transduction histidine kinase [Sulfuricella denitrificans skB26]|uniref:Oxygen sensor histidine kinase NreB n=1 Tax=Sulfuricella denitrificans (strain DSM 22764 / NBRC 105220 / skB26) TaxID=1163617 RepID=S6A9I8_SULDS|nr:sensor histidine kinase [Sulfuricella denitrificans]BAN34185.1 integral membrane sensor signal transduction histidine kinase [Sulfuricella denitrificans skB26]
MSLAIKKPFSRLSFSRQFMLTIIAVLLIGMAVIGTWLGRQIENSEVDRAAAISAIYLESIFAAQLHDWPGGGIVDNETHAVLDRIFVKGPLNREVLRFKLWDSDGRIVYSSDDAQIGLRFPVGTQLATAFAGTVQARISDLDEADNLPEHVRWPQLLEIYVPIRSGAQGEIIAVAEFYHSMESLGRDIRTAQHRSWLLVTGITLAIYLLLYSLVRRANDTIRDQQRDLRHQIQQLHSSLDENDHMRERLREAGVSTTTLNEEFLFRIAADLHDGPAQAIAFALMRFDEFAAACRSCALSPGGVKQDLHSIHGALQSSLRDVRRISSGLAMPGIADLSLADTARHAVRNFEHVSGQTVKTEIDEALDKAPLAVKITVYRLLQESLTNCWRHAPGGAPQVHVQQAVGQVLVTITDQGAGFDPQVAATAGRLGLTFMRERVRLLGGIFEINSAPGRGTCISARLPLSTDEMIHA